MPKSAIRERSGNHWTRYLVEEAAHIATSSVYCDFYPPHLAEPFEWGGYCCKNGYEGACHYPQEEDKVMVKTHFPALDACAGDHQPYDQIIRIVRHPVDSFYSYYVFMNANFARMGSSVTVELNTEQVKHFIQIWREFQEYWDQQPDVITFRYEDMLDDPATALRQMLRIMDYDVDEADIQRAVQRHPPEGKPLKHLAQFHPDDLTLIQSELSDIMQQYDYSLPETNYLSNFVIY